LDLGLPTLVPEFADQINENDKGSVLCTHATWADAVVFARVRDVRVVTTPVIVDGHEVGCRRPAPAVELEFEPLEVFLGEVPERFVLTLGGDLNFVPRFTESKEGLRWDDAWGLAGSLKPGHTVGMFMRRLDDTGQRWSMTWLGWFGMRSDQSLFEYPAGVLNFEPRLDGLSNSAFRANLAACLENRDDETRAAHQAYVEQDRVSILTTGRNITAFCFSPDGVLHCSDEACAAEQGF
jgi:hypothetical protein